MTAATVAPPTRFAFAGRVSTEDQQDPESSRNWQLDRARALVEPHGGVVVEEFFDVGQSRSVPWQRRPRAKALLDALKRPDRGFDAVVIGEPHRMFYGNQFGLIFPVFAHFGVGLWVPEVGGPVDPANDAHDLVMSIYGGVSKSERNRIKIRVRTSMAAQAAIEGRFLGGRPPYGYRLADAGPHPNPGKAADGKRLHMLEPDPKTAPVVRRIFAEYLSGLGFGVIADQLTDDGVPSPSAYDRARNPHRAGGPWQKSAVRAIVTNPRYTGKQVWNRQRRDEVLIDVDDVALGNETRMRWNDTSEWVWSQRDAHEALVTVEEYEAAQQRVAARGRTSSTAKRKPTTTRTFTLRRRMRCAACGRRMEATWRHGRAYYRCRHTDDPATATGRRSIYVREDAILRHLDGWLATVFDPDHVEATLDALVLAAAEGDGHEQREREQQREALRTRLAECDTKLDRYRATLDAGADPTVVTAWIAETQGERDRLHDELAATGDPEARREQITRDQLRQLLDAIGDVKQAILDTDALEEKADVYAELGVTLDYDPDNRTVTAECEVDGSWSKSQCRRGELNLDSAV